MLFCVSRVVFVILDRKWEDVLRSSRSPFERVDQQNRWRGCRDRDVQAWLILRQASAAARAVDGLDSLDRVTCIGEGVLS